MLALLSFIAELKPASVIFAMEEPEIAVPPHTQRRIADYLLHNTTQAFATSHSPYVIERFAPEQTLLLSRGPDSSVTAKKVSDAGGLKGNDFKRFARRGLTECMLGKGAIVVEGLTEFHALPVAARKLEESDTSLQPLDIAGAAFFDAESEGSMPKFGTFFKALGLKTFSFHDSMPRPPEKKKLFADATTISGRIWTAVTGALTHPPSGEAREVLAEDYARMPSTALPGQRPLPNWGTRSSTSSTSSWPSLRSGSGPQRAVFRTTAEHTRSRSSRRAQLQMALRRTAPTCSGRAPTAIQEHAA